MKAFANTKEPRLSPRAGSPAGTRLLANAAITLVALLLAFAAFDDITTDNATTFRVEYTFLAACAGWLLFVAWSLIRGGHRSLGFASVVALASALWAQRAIGPGMGPALLPEYVVMTTAYIWFWVLAIAMLWFSWRARKRGGSAALDVVAGRPAAGDGARDGHDNAARSRAFNATTRGSGPPAKDG